MKAEELMVGDWVYIRDCETIERVESITQKVIYTDASDDIMLDDVNPLPVTPEILEHNGFKLEHYWQLEIGPRVYVHYLMDAKVLQIRNGANYMICDCAAVHELQHAFRQFFKKDIKL